jgi:hypothetical protein
MASSIIRLPLSDHTPESLIKYPSPFVASPPMSPFYPLNTQALLDRLILGLQWLLRKLNERLFEAAKYPAV